MANFGPLTAEIGLQVWGTPANFNRFRVLAALLHGTLVVGVSQTLRRWTESATYIRQGGHHVGHWPTFLVTNFLHIHGERNLIISKSRPKDLRQLSDTQRPDFLHNSYITHAPADDISHQILTAISSSRYQHSGIITRPDVPCQPAKNVKEPKEWYTQYQKENSAGSRPKFTILWGHVEEVLLFNKFFSDCQYVP